MKDDNNELVNYKNLNYYIYVRLSKEEKIKEV